jgi:hypothetical protein
LKILGRNLEKLFKTTIFILSPKSTKSSFSIYKLFNKNIFKWSLGNNSMPSYYMPGPDWDFNDNHTKIVYHFWRSCGGPKKVQPNSLRKERTLAEEDTYLCSANEIADLGETFFLNY